MLAIFVSIVREKYKMKKQFESLSPPNFIRFNSAYFNQLYPVSISLKANKISTILPVELLANTAHLVRSSSAGHLVQPSSAVHLARSSSAVHLAPQPSVAVAKLTDQSSDLLLVFLRLGPGSSDQLLDQLKRKDYISYKLRVIIQQNVSNTCSEAQVKNFNLHTVLWLISTNGDGLGFGFGFEFQTLLLHCSMHNFFHWFGFGFGSLYG